MNLAQFAFVVAAVSGVSACQSHESKDRASGSVDFSALFVPDDSEAALPERQVYEARDGTRLGYRHYRADSDTWLILIHGSATDSVYLRRLARSIANEDAANVVTPDLRGHGPKPETRGDIAYIDQLQDDLADLVRHLKSGAAASGRVVIGGHSSGGGLALRFGGSEYGDLAAGYLLLAPYLGHEAPTVRENSGGWAEPSLARIVPIALANAIGIRWFNGIDVLRFNLPSAYRNGHETLAYSYRLMKGFGPVDYRAAFADTDAPILLLAGTADEAFYPHRYVPSIEPHNRAVETQLLDGVSHIGLVMREETVDRAVGWLAQF